MMRAIDLLSTLAERWWLWVLHAGWQIALVAIVVLAVLYFGKRLSSPLRHGLLLVALMKFLVPPFCALPTGVLSCFSIAAYENESLTVLAPSISTNSQLPSSPLAGSTRETAAETAVSSGESLSELVEQSRAERQFESDSVFVTSSESQLSHALDPAEASALSPRASEQSNNRAQLPKWRVAGMLLHFVGSTFFALVLVRRSRVLRAMIQAGEPFSAAQQQSIERHWSSSRPAPRGVIINENVLPFSYGIRRPVVVLPRQVIKRCTPAEVDTMILHELVHHRRHDLVVVILQAVVAVLWWFHPLMWLVQRQLEAAREDCCDDTLLGSQGVVPSAYAQLLLTVARLSAVPHVAGPSLAAGMPRYSQLRSRVIRIMEDSLPRRYQLSKMGLGILIVLCACVWPGVRATGNATAQQVSAAAQPSAEKLLSVTSEKDQAISGRVVQPDGTPLAGARIWLGPAVSGVFDMLSSTSLSSWYAETDADGSYMIAKPPWAQSQLHNRPACVVWCVGPNKELIVKPIVDVHDPDVGMIAFRPSERCRVTVVSQHAVTAETVTVAPASIVTPGPVRMHFHIPMEVREACSMECQLGSSVEFRFARGMSGFAMAVSAARFGTLESYAEPAGTNRKIALRPTGAVTGRVELPAGASYDLSRLKIRAATRISDSASLRGEMSDYGRASVQVDADGRFTIPAIAEGTLNLRVVVPPDCPYRTTRLTDYAITADKTTDVDIALKQCIRVHGSILDAATKQPIAGAIARLAEGEQHSAIDDRGEFTLWMLPQSTDTIFYDIPAEYYSRQQGTQVRVGDRDDVTLAPLLLSRAKVLAGTVRDAAGNSLPGLDVLIDYKSPNDAFDGIGMGDAFRSRQRTTSDVDGQFQFLGLPQNTPLTIAVLRHGIVLAQREIHPADSGEPVLVTRDFDAVSFNGRIVIPASISADNLRATLQYRRAGTDGLAGAVFAQTLALDSDGRFSTAAEYPREFDYRVEVYHVDRSILASGWVAPGDEPVAKFPELVITEQMISVATPAEKPTLDWHGTVVTTDGKPIPNATVTAWYSARHVYRHTDSNGAFDFADVSLGGGWLIVQADGYHCDGHFVEYDDVPNPIVMHRLDQPPRKQLATLPVEPPLPEVVSLAHIVRSFCRACDGAARFRRDAATPGPHGRDTGAALIPKLLCAWLEDPRYDLSLLSFSNSDTNYQEWHTERVRRLVREPSFEQEQAEKPVIEYVASDSLLAEAQSLIESDNAESNANTGRMQLAYRLARAAPEASDKLAISIKDPAMRAYALGKIAGVDGVPRERAVRLLQEAYTTLEDEVRAGRSQGRSFYHPLTVGVSLWPTVERIMPQRMSDFFWRTLALRRDVSFGIVWRALGPHGRDRRMCVADPVLALAVSRYDLEHANWLLNTPGDETLDLPYRESPYFYLPVLSVIQPETAIRTVDRLPEETAEEMNWKYEAWRDISRVFNRDRQQQWRHLQETQYRLP